MLKEIKEASRQRQLRQILRLPFPESKIVNEAFCAPRYRILSNLSGASLTLELDSIERSAHVSD